MRRTTWLLLVLGTCAAALGQSSPASPAGAASAAASQPAPALKLVILHVNDTHGQTLPGKVNNLQVPGYARLAGAIQQARKRFSNADDVLVIHAGDEFNRGDSLTRRSLGQANMALLNALGLDLWVPGNGEFYDGLPRLAARIAEASFPTLAANVTVRRTGKTLGEPYIIRRVGGARVALLGLCFVRTERPEANQVVVRNPVETARQLVPELGRQADVVVAVTHIGYVGDRLLAASVAGVDVIIGAHSHTLLKEGHSQNGPDGRKVLICQAGDLGRFLGVVELTLEHDGQRYRLRESKASVIPVDGQTPIDRPMQSLLELLQYVPDLTAAAGGAKVSPGDAASKTPASQPAAMPN